MSVYLIGKKYSDQLGNTRQIKVGTEGFPVLGFSPSQTEAVFEVVDGAFYVCPYLIGFLPLFGSTDGAGIGPQILNFQSF